MTRQRAAAGIVGALLLLAACTTSSDPSPSTPPGVAAPNVVPRPVELTTRGGEPFELTSGLTIAADPALAGPAAALEDLLADDTGIDLAAGAADAAIRLAM